MTRMSADFFEQIFIGDDQRNPRDIFPTHEVDYAGYRNRRLLININSGFS